MARKSIQVTGFTGRDAGKMFVITEMSAFAAEKWAWRALLALGRGGLDIPEDVAREGMAGIARFGLGALVSTRFEDLEPLMDEMFACVQIAPDPVKNPTLMRALIEDDIEEPETILRLRGEVLKLHVDFSKLAGLSKGSAEGSASGGSPDPQTSPT